MTHQATKKPHPLREAAVGPPDEKFWQRYSPRSELPLSSVASVSLHLLVLSVLLVGGVLLVRSQDTTKPLPTATIEIGDGPPGGGESDQREAQPSFKPEAIDRGQAASPSLPNAADDREKLQAPAPKAEEPPPQLNDPGERLIDEAELAAKKASSVADQVRATILKRQQVGPAGPNTRPKGGKPGGEMASQREPRMDRWVLNFETRDGGHDYARQLQALGAIVAIPRPDGQYLVIRDLKERPARGQIEDIGGIQRIFWVDDKLDSVRSLAGALQLDQVPPWFAAFFPEALERDLLRKELAFKNRREADIRKTYFRVDRKGNGYEPVVVRQEPRPGVK